MQIRDCPRASGTGGGYARVLHRLPSQCIECIEKMVTSILRGNDSIPYSNTRCINWNRTHSMAVFHPLPSPPFNTMVTSIAFVRVFIQNPDKRKKIKRSWTYLTENGVDYRKWSGLSKMEWIIVIAALVLSLALLILDKDLNK